MGGSGPDCAGTLASLGYNLITDAAMCMIGGMPVGNVIGQAAGLALLANNGGPTQTHALCTDTGDPDPSCTIASPAVDAGDPAGCTDPDGTPLTSDQRDLLRPQDGDRNGSSIWDIGAYEVQPQRRGQAVPVLDPRTLMALPFVMLAALAWRLRRAQGICAGSDPPLQRTPSINRVEAKRS